MQSSPIEYLWVGFGIACVGFMALNMSHRMRQQGFTRNPRRLSLVRDWGLIKQHVGVWPLVIAAVCIPAGIIMTFGAILYNNHSGLK